MGLVADSKLIYYTMFLLLFRVASGHEPARIHAPTSASALNPFGICERFICFGIAHFSGPGDRNQADLAEAQFRKIDKRCGINAMARFQRQSSRYFLQ